jgi:hypothetical protein
MEGKEDHVSVRDFIHQYESSTLVTGCHQGSGGKEESYVFNV